MKKLDEDGRKFLEQLGYRIKKIREQSGISQEKFAAECEFDRTYISLVERGKRNLSIANLRRIAVSLKISLCELFKDF